MPRLLTDRFADDCIREFRIAAAIRNEDAWHLARSDRSAAAIYLWGYAAEMTLKAAWFKLIGYPDNRAILPRDLQSAVTTAETRHGIQWPRTGRLHAISHWALLLIRHRMVLGCGHPDPAFGVAVLEHSRRVYERWRETLRYKKNRPYPFEVLAVAESTQWLIFNSSGL